MSDMARLEFGEESLYLIVSKKPVKGKKFCEEFKHQEACMDDCCCVDSGDGGIEDFGFEKPVTGELVKSGLGREARENGGCEVRGLVMSEGPPTATSTTRTSKPPTPAPTTEAVSQDVSVRSKKAVKGQAVNGQKTSLVRRTYSQVAKDLDEDGFKLVMSKKEKKETNESAAWESECLKGSRAWKRYQSGKFLRWPSIQEPVKALY